MAYIDRLFDLKPPDLNAYRSFIVENQTVGHIGNDFADKLAAYPDIFIVTQSQVVLHPDIQGFQPRTNAICRVLTDLYQKNVISTWHNELFPVSQSFNDAPLLAINRSAAACFGIKAYGVHLNGFIEDKTGIKMWIAKRADDRFRDPGKLDQIVAGGQPLGLTVKENLAKECEEEACIPETLVRQAKSVGIISYCAERTEGLRNDILFIFDLRLPDHFTPRNQDGEIADFYLMPMEKVLTYIRETEKFKFNCAPVVIDFAIRHGLIGPEEPDYIDLICHLRSQQDRFNDD